jgi:Ca2+-binding EF-hand superfamily protein
MPPHDVPDLLDRKFDVCFGHGDTNGDGVLESADALALAARIIAFLGESFSSPKAHALLEAFENFWKNLQPQLDSNHDGKITPLEWRTGLREAFARDPKDFDNGFKPLAAALFSICDRDDDGKVAPIEFAGFHKAFGMSPHQSLIAFEHLDSDRNGYLSPTELVTAWQEFYTSDDPNAAGNWLYGDVWDESIWEGTKVKL